MLADGDRNAVPVAQSVIELLNQANIPVLSTAFAHVHYLNGAANVFLSAMTELETILPGPM